MKSVVALLTTYNRPELLGQSLPQILRQCEEIDAELVIADDQSTMPGTLSLLKWARDQHGAELIQRDYLRDGRQTRHQLTGLNAFFAFNHVLAVYEDVTHILKLDDDIFLADGAFQTILDTYDKAEAEGYYVLACSGIQTKNEQLREERDGYNLTISPCAAATLYQREDISIAFDQRSFKPATHSINGWDWTFWENYGRKFKPHGVAVATRPSVVFHTGNKNGTHVRGDGINVNFRGSIEGVIEG